MSSFREFILSEAPITSPLSRSRVAGIYELPDPDTMRQRKINPTTGQSMPMIPVGGYNDPAHYAQWHTNQQRWNQSYPLEKIHGVSQEQLQHNIIQLNYEQAKAAFVDLASRVEAIGSVIASGGNVPGDKDMTARMKQALFQGQKFGQPPNKSCNIFLIYNVDGRVFFGEVSGRGGTLGFKLAEALEIVTPTNTPDQDPESKTTGQILGNHYDIDVKLLQHHLYLAVKEFTRWERELQSKVAIGQLGNTILDKMSQGKHVKSTLATHPFTN